MVGGVATLSTVQWEKTGSDSPRLGYNYHWAKPRSEFPLHRLGHPSLTRRNFSGRNGGDQGEDSPCEGRAVLFICASIIQHSTWQRGLPGGGSLKDPMWILKSGNSSRFVPLGIQGRVRTGYPLSLSSSIFCSCLEGWGIPSSSLSRSSASHPFPAGAGCGWRGPSGGLPPSSSKEESKLMTQGKAEVESAKPQLWKA